MKLQPLTKALLSLAGLLVATATAPAQMLSYYVGIDDLPTIATGTYAGLPNPNFNRLTFLLAHTYPVGGVPTGHTSNHYHSKGIYRYTGPNLGASTATTFTVNNFVPENLSDPITLTLGTGIYADKLITVPSTDPLDADAYMTFLTMGNTKALSGFAPDAGETFLFNSSAGRWNSAFDDADVHLELVNLTPGLNVGTAAILNLLSVPGDEHHLGDGTDLFQFTPVLWVNQDAAPGIYEATFKLTDESGTFGDSGEFRIRTQVVPEPTAAVAVIGGMGLLLGRRRRATRG